MTTTLQNGIKIPDKYSRDWYADLSINWNLLDSLIGQVASGTFQHDVIPSTTGTYKLGSSTNIWDAVYGNAYFLGTTPFGDIVTHNASEFAATSAIPTKTSDLDNDSGYISNTDDCVHITGAETISGDKTHDANLAITGNHLFAWDRPQVTMGTNPTSGVYFGTQRFRDSNGDSFMLVRGAVNTYGNTSYSITLYPWSNPTAACGWNLSTTGDGSISYFNPVGTVNLGSTSSKWQSLNGINPGALSFPNNSAYIDISSSITDRTYGANSFVAAANGWISIGSFATAIQIADDTTGMATTGLPGSDGYSSVVLPVRAGDSIRVLINQTSTTFQSFRLLPCLGNV